MKKPFLMLGIAFLNVLALTSCTFSFIPSEKIETKIPDHVHTYEDTVVEPTCTEKGYTRHSCTKCDYYYDSDKVAALGHIKTNGIKTDVTCTTDGYTTYVCSRCGETFIDDIVKVDGHIAGIPVKENAVAATCEEEGSYELVTYCKYCGVEMSRETVITDALGHDYDYSIGTIEPTCISAGWTTGGKCTRCGKIIGDGALQPLGHNYVDTESSEILNNGITRELYQCSRCKAKAYTIKSIDYTQNYDYRIYCNSSLYQEHRLAYKEMYKTLFEGCMKILSSTSDYECPAGKEYYPIAEYNYAEEGMTSKEAGNVILSFIMNNPWFYFIKVSTYYSSDTKVIMVLDPNCFRAEYRASCEKNIKDSVIAFTGSLTENMTDKEKAESIHDYIIRTIDYQYDSPGIPSTQNWAHSIMGTFDNNSATGGVCECYTKTYQYLSCITSLETISVSGTANTGGTVGGHAWNYTKVGSSWYGVDATWDDQTRTIYTYFLASKSTMDSQHFAGTSDITSETDYFQVLLPELSETTYES